MKGKLLRKNLSPDQYKRANKVTSVGFTLVYAIFLLINLATDPTFNVPKALLASVVVINYSVDLFLVYKNWLDSKRGMLCMCVGFTITYAFTLFTHAAGVITLAFPVIMILTCYMNELLILLGSGAAFVIIVLRLIQFIVLDDVSSTRTTFMCIFGVIICVYGGCKAVRLLVEFSNEESRIIVKKSAEQKKVAEEVERIVDELDTSFREVVEELHILTTAVGNTSGLVDEIAFGSEGTATATIQQAEKTEEIQKRLERTNTIVAEAVETTGNLQNYIEIGKTESDELERQSDIVDSATNQISNTVEQLVGNVGQVTSITDSILKISSQTNLLALNASIEAARAGEAGRGFAVVAEQIRKLAEETKTSTERITSIVNDLTNVTDETKSALDKSVVSIKAQREKVKEVHESFTKVEEGMSSVSHGMNSMGKDVNAIIEANSVIVDGITTLSGVSEEISADTENCKSNLDTLVMSMDNFSKIVDESFVKLQRLKEVAAAKED